MAKFYRFIVEIAQFLNGMLQKWVIFNAFPQRRVKEKYLSFLVSLYLAFSLFKIYLEKKRRKKSHKKKTDISIAPNRSWSKLKTKRFSHS